jgi:hypothetical protein
MKQLLAALALLGAASSLAQAQTSLSVEIGQPGFYGRLDIGDFRQPPPVVYREPIIIEQRAHYVAEPLYLRVPPGHMKKWDKHCARYNACGRRVFFVKDDWYLNTYAPRYRETHVVERHERHPRAVQAVERDGGHGKGHPGKGHDKDHGQGKGHGHGHGKHKD